MILKGFRLRSYIFFFRSENVGGLQGARNPASGGVERPGGREGLPPNVLACPTGFKYRLVEILTEAYSTWLGHYMVRVTMIGLRTSSNTEGLFEGHL